MKNDTQNDTQKTWFDKLTESKYEGYREKNPLTQLSVFAKSSKKPSFLDKIIAVYLCVTGLNSYDDPVPNALITDGVYDLLTCGVTRLVAQGVLNAQGEICSNMGDSSPLEHCSVDRCFTESLIVMLFAATSAIAFSVDIIPRHAFALAFAIMMIMPVAMQHLYSKMLTAPSETESTLTENTLVARV